MVQLLTRKAESVSQVSYRDRSGLQSQRLGTDLSAIPFILVPRRYKCCSAVAVKSTISPSRLPSCAFTRLIGILIPSRAAHRAREQAHVIRYFLQ